MDFIMVPSVFGIISFGIYKLFELFVCKKERLAIIEKMGEKLTPDMLEHKINFSSINSSSFSALKFGSLFVGLGLGLLIAFFIHYHYADFCDTYFIRSAMYGSCVLIFGGIGLLTAFLVELKIGRRKD